MKNNARKIEGRQEVGMQLLLPTMTQVRATLLDTVLNAGMVALATLLEDERTTLCGPRYQHDAERQVTRAGHAKGELAMGGRRVSLSRPRVRGKNGEVALPSWERFSNEDPLTDRAVEQMLVGVATRKYARSLEPMPPGVQTRGTSKSSVSRRFVEATSKGLEEMMRQDLSSIDLVALMLDGIAVGDHTILVALGIDAGGTSMF